MGKTRPRARETATEILEGNDYGIEYVDTDTGRVDSGTTWTTFLDDLLIHFPAD